MRVRGKGLRRDSLQRTSSEPKPLKPPLPSHAPRSDFGTDCSPTSGSNDRGFVDASQADVRGDPSHSAPAGHWHGQRFERALPDSRPNPSSYSNAFGLRSDWTPRSALAPLREQPTRFHWAVSAGEDQGLETENGPSDQAMDLASGHMLSAPEVLTTYAISSLVLVLFIALLVVPAILPPVSAPPAELMLVPLLVLGLLFFVARSPGNDAKEAPKKR